jgi:voltage-gated potassium channel
MALIDLAAIAPFYLQILLPGMDLRFLRVLRMLRILKITRYSLAMNVLLGVLHKEREAFIAVFTILIMVLIMVSCGIHLVEGHIQPEAFGSIPDSMWWALATLTTVGYGDVAPITPLGKIFGAMVMIIGIGIIALPAGILASSFSEILRRRQQEFRLSVKKAMEDGEISDAEAEELNKIREELNLSEEDSKELSSQTQKELEVDKRYEVAWEKIALRDVEYEATKQRQPHDHSATCPHCGGKLPD